MNAISHSEEILLKAIELITCETDLTHMKCPMDLTGQFSVFSYASVTSNHRPRTILAPVRFLAHKAEWSARKNFTPVLSGDGHIGSHLRFLKLLKGQNATHPWISLWASHRWIISKEKNSTENFRLCWKTSVGSLNIWADYICNLPRPHTLIQIKTLRPEPALCFFNKSLWFFVEKQYSSIGSDNGLAPARRQAIIWTNDG